MWEDMHYIDEFFKRLEESQKIQMLKNAGIPDDRPDLLITGKLHSWGEKQNNEAVRWMHPHRAVITALLLRMRDLPNRDIRRLVEDGDLYPGRTAPDSEVRISISLLGDQRMERKNSQTNNRVPLTDLAAASAIMSEMFVTLGGANSLILPEIPSAPPDVRVKSGSIEFAVGGSLFASGIGLIVGCSAGLVAAPIVGPAAGVLLASAGIMELALGWKQKIAEIQKIQEETRVIRISHDEIVIRQNRRLRELEIKAKELELEAARMRAQEEKEAMEARFAHSSLVPREVVLSQAENLGLTEAYANHILNRGLPTYIELKRYFAEIKIKAEKKE